MTPRTPEPMQVNLFTHYEQEENRFTNALIALLELSRHNSKRPHLLKSFLHDLLHLPRTGGIHSFRVLRNIDGTADAELCSKDWCIRIESKIRSGTIRDKQV